MRIDRDPTLVTSPPVMAPVMAAVADDRAAPRPRRLARGSVAPPEVTLPALVLPIRTIDAPDADWSPVEPITFPEGTGAHAEPARATTPRPLDRAAPFVVGALLAATAALLAVLALA